MAAWAEAIGDLWGHIGFVVAKDKARALEHTQAFGEHAGGDPIDAAFECAKAGGPEL